MPATTGFYPEANTEGLSHTFACSTIGAAGLNLRRLEGVSVAPFAAREASAEILSVLREGSPPPLAGAEKEKAIQISLKGLVCAGNAELVLALRVW
jgi:hypothetical protein